MKIKILAKDIKNTNYTDSNNCAITKALKRAGLSNLEDAGTDIIIKGTNEVVVNTNNKNYKKLTDRVVNMYRYCKPNIFTDGETEKPVDFTVDLPLAKFRPKKK